MHRKSLFEIDVDKNKNQTESVVIDAEEITTKNEKIECENYKSYNFGEEQKAEQHMEVEEVKVDKDNASFEYPKPETIEFPNVTNKKLDTNVINKLVKQSIAKSSNKIYINYKYLRDEKITNKIVRLAELKREIKKYKKTKHISEEEYKKLLAEQTELRR